MSRMLALACAFALMSGLMAGAAVAQQPAAPPPYGPPITLDQAAGLPDIRGDRMLLREALLNVVSNAAEACAPAGGDVIGIAALVVQHGDKRAHKATLVGMYVRPEARRAGVGRRLLETVIDLARRRYVLRTYGDPTPRILALDELDLSAGAPMRSAPLPSDPAFLAFEL